MKFKICMFLMTTCCLLHAHGDDAAAVRWVERFSWQPMAPVNQGVCTGEIGVLPGFTVTPAAEGPQLVRVAVPFAPGALPAGLGLVAVANGVAVPADVRTLTLHPGVPASVRRAMVSFVFTLESRIPHTFSLRLTEQLPDMPPLADQVLQLGGLTVSMLAERVEVADGTNTITAIPFGPTRASSYPVTFERIESGSTHQWARLLVPDDQWPRILDVQLDSLGTVTLTMHWQRLDAGDAYTPTLGWDIKGLSATGLPAHSFANGDALTLTTSDGTRCIDFPNAHLLRRGSVESNAEGVRYTRCTDAERVPMQSTAWRSATLVIRPANQAPRTALLMPSHAVALDAEATASLSAPLHGMDLALWPALDRLEESTRDAVVRSACVGDDFGNVTGFSQGAEHGGYYGMNRLNHGVPMFWQGWSKGDRRVLDTISQWCVNMHDLSIWWGDTPDCGGTRYNAAIAAGEKEHEGDTSFMWRTNWTSHFCTKGFSAFLFAYEETGDPRMLTALRHQVAYAKEYVHVDKGECRNIGDVNDFLVLYRAMGDEMYLNEALRLFRELRTKLSTGDLFSQGGQPIEPDPVFIDDDAMGTKHPFAKPYIIGYALSGLPELLTLCPDEPKLKDVVRAVAHFLAGSVDPAGGWRYPAPDSSRCLMGQGIEHAAQLARAADALEACGEPVGPLVDAVETVLQARVIAYAQTGTILSGLSNWEDAAKAIPEGKTIHDLYAKPSDRDKSRDYTEGNVGIGSAPPEGLSYVHEVLEFYLRHRPMERLFHANPKLAQVLARTSDRRLKLSATAASTRVNVARADDATIAFDIDAFGQIAIPGFEFAPTDVLSWTPIGSTGALACTVERETGTFVATLTPEVDAITCSFTFWPKPGALPCERLTVSPTLLVDAPEVALKDDGELRAYTKGEWTAGIAVEGGTTGVALRKDVPTTVRSRIYLVRGTVDSVKPMAARDLQYWQSVEAAAEQGVQRTDTYGMRALLPSFSDARIQRMTFPMAWDAQSGVAFTDWRANARAAFLDTLATPPPPAPFAPTVIAEEDRGTYVARTIALNLSADTRVLGYLLVPKSEGRHPAILALHDHGAHFSIGKEKVIKPFGVSDERMADAQDWVNKYYGGRWFGDELAKRGYVVFSTDALFWGDRGRYEGVEYEEQNVLASNILQLGMTWAGTIVQNDIRSGEFVQGLAEVDPERIGCLGLSMGSNRSWHLAAATDIIKVGAAICWMGDTKTLLAEGNNQTTGQSAFSMLHPGLRNALDFPDVASIACPKPMLFYNGDRDGLFPIEGVNDCYKKMHAVWTSQGVDDRLETRIWPVPHEFNAEMQDAAFPWLDRWLKPAE